MVIFVKYITFYTKSNLITTGDIIQFIKMKKVKGQTNTKF